jgi:hypothetical protein
VKTHQNHSIYYGLATFGRPLSDTLAIKTAIVEQTINFSPQNGENVGLVVPNVAQVSQNGCLGQDPRTTESAENIVNSVSVAHCTFFCNKVQCATDTLCAMFWPHLGYPGNFVKSVFFSKFPLEAPGGSRGRPGTPRATKMTPKATLRDPKITPETSKNSILGDAWTL